MGEMRPLERPWQTWENMILKWMLRNLGGRDRFIWLRIGTSDRLLLT
jgi:hypothetical protein